MVFDIELFTVSSEIMPKRGKGGPHAGQRRRRFHRFRRFRRG